MAITPLPAGKSREFGLKIANMTKKGDVPYLIGENLGLLNP